MIEANAEWKKNLQVNVKVRQFEVDVDEPPQFHGDDTGMMPTELFISSLASCFCMALVFVAKKKRINFEDMTVKVNAEADNEHLRYSKMTVTVASSLSNNNLEPLIEQAKKYCYVTNTISQCCPIEYAIG
jgi:uncharacterized OsmC-like protein